MMPAEKRPTVPKTITITLHREETVAIVEAIPPDELDATIEDYILIADRILRSVRVSERDALSEIFGRLDGFEQTFRQVLGELGKSQRRGAIGEEEVLLDLNTVFGPADRFVRASTTARAGDIQGTLSNGEVVLLEIKNYSKNVPSAEVRKFWRDMRERNFKYGIFVSLRTPISGMTTENFAYRQQGPRRGIFVVNSAFDNIGHRMAIEYIKRLIGLERLVALPISKADLEAIAASIGDELHNIRDTLNLAAEVRGLAQGSAQAVQSNMAQIDERIIELQIRVRTGLDSIDRALRYLSGDSVPGQDASTADENWIAILDLLPEDSKMAGPLRTLCAGLVGHQLTFEPAGSQRHKILCQTQEVGCLEVQKTKLTVWTNLDPSGLEPSVDWKPAGKKDDYHWKRDFRSASDVREHISSVAQLLSGQVSESSTGS
jgi:hypothetical protein